MIADSFVQLDHEFTPRQISSLGMSLSRNGNVGDLSDRSVDQQYWQELLRSNPFARDTDPDQVTRQAVTQQAYDDKIFQISCPDDFEELLSEDKKYQKVCLKKEISHKNSSDGGENHSCDDEELVIQEIKRASESPKSDSKSMMNPLANLIKYVEFEQTENLLDESEETQTQFTVQKQNMLNDSLNIFSQSIDTPGSNNKVDNYQTP